MPVMLADHSPLCHIHNRSSLWRFQEAFPISVLTLAMTDGRDFKILLWSRHTFILMLLSSTKSNTGFRFSSGAEDLFAPAGYPGEKPVPVAKYSSCKWSSTGWSDGSGETLNKLCGEARLSSGFTRGGNWDPRLVDEYEALFKQNASALASFRGPHLTRMN